MRRCPPRCTDTVRCAADTPTPDTADWWSTFAYIAGVDPTDHRAAKWGLPPIDSLNMWPMLSGTNTTSPRTIAPLGGVPGPRAIVESRFKLLLGSIPMSGWVGPTFPNASSMSHSFTRMTTDCSAGCLFVRLRRRAAALRLFSAGARGRMWLPTRLSTATWLQRCPPRWPSSGPSSRLPSRPPGFLAAASRSAPRVRLPSAGKAFTGLSSRNRRVRLQSADKANTVPMECACHAARSRRSSRPTDQLPLYAPLLGRCPCGKTWSPTA